MHPSSTREYPAPFRASVLLTITNTITSCLFVSIQLVDIVKRSLVPVLIGKKKVKQR